VLVVLCTSCRSEPALEGDPEILVLDRAAFALGDGAAPPPSETYRPVSLPDRWNVERPSHTGSGWYRFSIPRVRVEAERQAIYLPKLNMNAAVFVNGEWIGQGGTFERPVAQSWNRPLYFSLSPRLLQEDDNIVDVRLFAYEGELGGLDPIFAGPDRKLRPSYESRLLRNITLAQLASGLTVVMALFIGALWLGKDRSPVYGYLALAALVFSLPTLNYHIERPPIGHREWTWLMHTSVDWFGVLAACFTHRWLNLERRRLERWLLGFGLGSSALLAVMPTPWFTSAAAVVHIVTLGIGAHCAYSIVRNSAKLHRNEAVLTLSAGVASVLFGIHDIAIHAGLLPRDSPRLVNFIAVTIVLCFGAVMINHFLRTYRAAEDLNRHLESRVRERERELEKHHALTRHLEGRELVSRERERIMREMHDGLGGNLVSTLAMIEDGPCDPEPVAEALRSALDDMRLVIDSLDPDVDDIPTLLAMIRCRIEPRLERSGLRFKWKVGDLPPLPGAGPEEFLHVMRIVQEAITNVIKHAGATTVTVTTGTVDGEPAGVFVEVRDDGSGLDAPGAAGRGLTNMRRRADVLGGDLTVSASEAGTAVRLVLPISRRPR
jgi:signal transduction histidine kinase